MTLGTFPPFYAKRRPIQAAYITPPSTDSDPIQRLHSSANFVLSLLADLNPATAAKLREYALAFAYYQAEEFKKLHSLSKRDATVQDIVNLWTEAAEDFHELIRLHASPVPVFHSRFEKRPDAAVVCLRRGWLSKGPVATRYCDFDCRSPLACHLCH